jgi:hypothetical protein
VTPKDRALGGIVAPIGLCANATSRVRGIRQDVEGPGSVTDIRPDRWVVVDERHSLHSGDWDFEITNQQDNIKHLSRVRERTISDGGRPPREGTPGKGFVVGFFVALGLGIAITIATNLIIHPF